MRAASRKKVFGVLHKLFLPLTDVLLTVAFESYCYFFPSNFNRRLVDTRRDNYFALYSISLVFNDDLLLSKPALFLMSQYAPGMFREHMRN